MTSDPLLLGQRVVAILETGPRTATYKLATLMALIEHCIENLPPQPDDRLAVPIPELAHRVLSIYWQQVRPFDGRELRQSTQPRAPILIAANELRAASGRAASVDVARLRAPSVYVKAIDDIMMCLVQQPLYRLQRLPGTTTSDPFLYDDSFLHDQVSRPTLRAHGDAIVLNPGVAHGLARLAGLLKPAMEIMWVDDVRRMNKFLDAEVPDVAGHLFGRARMTLAAVREPFKEAFGPHCFYCGAHLPANNPIDHVLPWSLVGIDGLANLVLACARCNGDKSGALPAVAIVEEALSEQPFSRARGDRGLDRVADAARARHRGRAGHLSRAAHRSTDMVGSQADRTSGRQLPAAMATTVNQSLCPAERCQSPAIHSSREMGTGTGRPISGSPAARSQSPRDMNALGDSFIRTPRARPLKKETAMPAIHYDVIGDVHGCATELKALLDAMGYRVARLGRLRASDASGRVRRRPGRSRRRASGGPADRQGHGRRR